MEGLSGNIGLAELTMADINAIEQQMRDRGEQRVRLDILNHPEKYLGDYFREYAQTPDQFTFSVGDKFVLRSIVAAVKANGIAKYIPNPCNSNDNMNLLSDKEKDKESLIARIKQKMSKR